MERLVHVTAPKGKTKSVCAVAEKEGARVLSISSAHKGACTVAILVVNNQRQDLFDKLQAKLGARDGWSMVVQDVEAVIPQPEARDKDQSAGESREELFDKVADGARLNWPVVALIAISAVVAAVGMVGNSVAVVIGAMVIAPLLGPILAVILGTALGERQLILRALRVLAVGCVIAIVIGAVAGWFVKYDPEAGQIATRSNAGLENVALALASGAAAALSLTTGVAAVLVGVMVAAALLPPATAIGMFLGKALFFSASGAALLLLINVSAITLAGQLVFLAQGIRPRSWYKKQKASQSVKVSLVFWSLLLLALVGLSYLRLLSHPG